MKTDDEDEEEDKEDEDDEDEMRRRRRRIGRRRMWMPYTTSRSTRMTLMTTPISIGERT